MKNNQEGQIILQTILSRQQQSVREQIEEALFYFAAIVGSSQDAIISKNLDGIITSWNPAAEEMFGYTAQEAIGKSITLIIPKNLQQEEEIILNKIKTGNRIDHFETIRVRKDGKKLHISLSISPVKNDDGKIIGAAKIARNITEQQKIKAALRQSEEQYRLVVENSLDLITLSDPQTNYIYVSPSFEKVLGYDQDELIGRPGLNLIHPEDRSHIENEIQKTLRGETYHTVFRIRHKKGHHLFMEGTGKSIFDTEGNLILRISTMHDVTEQKKAEERQQFLEKASLVLGTSLDYATTLKNIAKLIIPQLADYCRIALLDDNQNIKEITVHHRDMKKIPMVKELYHAYHNRTETTHGLGQLVKVGKSEIIPEITREIIDTIKDNPKLQDSIKSLGLVSYMGVPMKVGNKIIGAITFSSTQKERVYNKKDLLLAEELARRAAYATENAKLYMQLQQSLALRDEFISVASHELKTPVTSLKMYTQGLQKQFERRGEKSFSPYLSKMNKQIDKLTMLISDLLNVSRVQSGRLEFEKETFDLNKVVLETIETIQPTTTKHKILVKGKITNSVLGDKERIGQVLTNLVTNAVKYSPTADKVIVHLIPEKDVALVRVQDFGIGIEKKHLGKLFNRFYRVIDTNEQTFPGLGIGLYIANEIIKHHGGMMNVVSAKGKGSEFSFRLPYGESS